jgi:beta-lactam-binding protein with PASTA domain
LFPLFGNTGRIDDETEITASHEVVQPPAPPRPPPDARPPAFLARDVWPWLAALGVLAIVGLLVWLLVLRDNGNKGKVVPAVVGLHQQQAIAKLTGEGFSVRAIIGPAGKPRGIVVSQSPGGGSRVGKNQSVTVHVSSGQPLTTKTQAATTTASTTTGATTTGASQLAAVPDVTGQDLASAVGQVEAAGFVPETDPVTSAGTPGSVASEDPAAGTQANTGSVVRLSVTTGSSRPSTTIPRVVGQKASSARAALTAAKLTVKSVYRKGPAGRVGVVLAETPTGTAPAYTQVTLTVGS